MTDVVIGEMWCDGVKAMVLSVRSLLSHIAYAIISFYMIFLKVITIYDARG